jgi:hypothetical protein
MQEGTPDLKTPERRATCKEKANTPYGAVHTPPLQPTYGNPDFCD